MISSGVILKARSSLDVFVGIVNTALATYRDLEEMMLERGVDVDHTTLFNQRNIQHLNRIIKTKI